MSQNFGSLSSGQFEADCAKLLIFSENISNLKKVCQIISVPTFWLSFYKNFFKVGLSGVLGGIFLAIAFTGFIYSITITTAAVTLFMLAAMPFIAAIFGYFFLGEILRLSTFISECREFDQI